MLRKLVDHHDIDPSFLEVPISFSERMTDEEQSFCVPWTYWYVRWRSSSIARLTSSRNVLYLPVRRRERPRKRTVGDSPSRRIPKAGCREEDLLVYLDQCGSALGSAP
jgi:hypothetical protein